MTFKTIICFVSLGLMSACADMDIGLVTDYPSANQTDYAALQNQELTVMAQQGDAEAQFELGNRLCCGNEAEHDNQLGYTLMCEAAKQGVSEAQYRLGELHQHGVSFALSPYTLEPFLLPEDEALAYMWFSVAAENGNEDAEDAREELHEEMSFEQLNRALAVRKIWKRTACTQFGKAETLFHAADEPESIQ